MSLRISMFGFKNGVGYQLDRHKREQRLFERYNERSTRLLKMQKKNIDIDYSNHSKGINIRI